MGLNRWFYWVKFVFTAALAVFNTPALLAATNCFDDLTALFKNSKSYTSDLYIPENVMDLVDEMLREKLGLSLPDNFDTVIWAEDPQTGIKQILLGPLQANENTPPKILALVQEAQNLGAQIYVHSIGIDKNLFDSNESIVKAQFGPSFFHPTNGIEGSIIALSPGDGLEPFVLAHELEHLRNFTDIVSELQKKGLSEKDLTKELQSRWSTPRSTFQTERNAVIAESKFRKQQIEDGELPRHLDSTNPLTSSYIRRMVYPYFAALTLSTRQVALYFEIFNTFKIGKLTEFEVQKRISDIARLLEPIFWRTLITSRAHFEALLNHTASLKPGSEIETSTLLGLAEFIGGLASWKANARNIGLLKDFVEYSRSFNKPLEKRVFKSLPLRDSWEKTRLKYLEKNPYGRNADRPDLFYYALTHPDADPIELARYLVNERRNQNL